MIYLDTSALAKLVVEEAESAALATWLDGRSGIPLVTSVVGRIELLGAARRRGPEVLPRAIGLLAELALVPLGPDVVDTSWSLDPPAVRTLDAIHLASAASLGSGLSAVVAYDVRLVAAATTMGLPVASPA